MSSLIRRLTSRVSRPIISRGTDPHHDDYYFDPVPGWARNYAMGDLEFSQAIGNPTYIAGVALPDKGAMGFNGTTDAVNKDSDAQFLVGAETLFSVSLWVKPDAGSNDTTRHMLTYGSTAPGGTGFSLSIPVLGTLKARFISGAAGFNSTPDLTPDEWNHVVYTINGTSRKIYVNNVVTNNTNTVNTFTSNNLRLASNAASTASFLKGGLDRVLIYINKELTPAEVTLLYNDRIP